MARYSWAALKPTAQLTPISRPRDSNSRFFTAHNFIANSLHLSSEVILPLLGGLEIQASVRFLGNGVAVTDETISLFFRPYNCRLSTLDSLQVTLSPQNRSSTKQYC